MTIKEFECKSFRNYSKEDIFNSLKEIYGSEYEKIVRYYQCSDSIFGIQKSLLKIAVWKLNKEAQE